MKIFYTRFCSPLVTLVLIISLNNPVKAQPHAPGDIAFTGYHSQTTSRFSFVLLKNFTAGQTISFTEASWLNATNNFDIDEGMITWTVPAGDLAAGREVIINCVTNVATLLGAGSPGTVTVNTISISLNTSGDQIFAFTGTLAAPTSVLSGLHMNSLDIPVNFDACNTNDAIWDGACATGNNSYSYKPSGGGLNTLTNGTNALRIGSASPDPYTEFDNAVFNCASVPAANLLTVAGIRAAVNNKANWTTHQGANPQATIPLPAGCNWLGPPLSVNLESFTGKLNTDKTVTLQWKVAAQQDVQEYILEESADGSSFSTLGTVTPGASNSYSYLDAQVGIGKNYYRLKTVELSGKITYSSVVIINLKAGIIVSLYPNPVTDKLTIQQFGAIQNKTAVLSDGRGNILQQIKLTSQQQTVDMQTYPAGVYILKMEDGTVFKVVKQ